MATLLYCTDTLADLTISGYVVRKLSLTRGAGLVSKTVTSDASSPMSVYDTGTTPLAFAFRYAEEHTLTTADDPILNVWGLESNTMANYGPRITVDLYNDDGTYYDQTFDTAVTGTEWGTSAAVRVVTGSQNARTVIANKWIVLLALFGSVGTPASGYTLTWSYGATSAGVNGDTYLTLVPTLTESFNVADSVPHYRQPRMVGQAVPRASSWMRRHDGLLVPPERRLGAI